jgi:EpsI family protein
MGFPFEFAGWHGRAGAPLDKRTLEILGADDYLTRLYVDGRGSLASLYVGYHGAQKQGTSIHSPLNCLPGSGWVPVQSSRIQIGSTTGVRTVNRVVIEKSDDRQLVLYWYQGRGRVIADEYVSKAYQFIDALRRRRTDAALVRIISPIDQRGESFAEASAIRFAVAVDPILPRHVPD